MPPRLTPTVVHIVAAHIATRRLLASIADLSKAFGMNEVDAQLVTRPVVQALASQLIQALLGLPGLLEESETVRASTRPLDVHANLTLGRIGRDSRGKVAQLVLQLAQTRLGRETGEP